MYKNHKGGFKIKDLFRAFKNSIRGLFVLAKSETNVLLEVLAGIITIITSLFLKLSSIEWVIIFIIIFLVIFAELVNTTIEKIMDFIEPKYNEQVKDIKDLASGFVFLMVVLSIITAFIVLFPKIIAFLTS